MRSERKVLIGFGVSAVIIATAFLGLCIKVSADNYKPFTNVYSCSSDMERSSVVIEFDSVQTWTKPGANNPIGAEYDGKIRNNKNGMVSEWVLTIELPHEGCVIDSSWNGTYSITGTTLTIVPDGNTNEIPAGSSKTFGLVLYSKSMVKAKSITFTGYLSVSIKSYPTFWILLGVAFIWLILFSVHVLSLRKIRKLEERRLQDEDIISQTMITLASMIDAKDKYTKGHSFRVAQYTVKLARKLGMKQDEIRNLNYIALMHDCGKIGVPDEVLNKPGRLTDGEFKVIQSHTIAGGRILEHFSAIEGIRDGALYHHERYDGKGYPEGLKGENIPYYARIICVADSFDAMNSNRCYRMRLKRDVIVSELEKNSGTQFDPKIAECMIELVNDNEVITES